jgi:hypothetical protein
MVEYNETDLNNLNCIFLLDSSLCGLRERSGGRDMAHCSEFGGTTEIRLFAECNLSVTRIVERYTRPHMLYKI